MKRGDFLWGLTLIGIIAFLAVPTTHIFFVTASKTSPYLTGLVKFAVLASMGELLAIRIVAGDWNKPKGFLWRAIIWGILGIIITLMFVLYDAGVRGCIEKGYLPFIKGTLGIFFTAFFTSTLMNLFFAPAFMLCHRLSDAWIDVSHGKMSLMVKAQLNKILDAAGLNDFISFVVFKSIPFFWIPAHTITFLLPPEYRVLMAAMLSICLGVILGFSKKGRSQ